MIINDLLKQKLSWTPDLSTERCFETSDYDKQQCYLQMNNFPDEPMWTLVFKGESINFDDAPAAWQITYRSDVHI